MTTFRNIIPPVDRALLRAELTEDKMIRKANKGNNELYCFTAHNAPNLMKEVGRLRELTFRTAGGGTGKAFDIDEYDVANNCYHQLIVWNPQEQQILGGYRYIPCHETCCSKKDKIGLATSHMFNYSKDFTENYLPYTLELGRSFIHPSYQSSNIRVRAKSIFVLDNLWDGLWALFKIFPTTRYFFGKITMYSHYNNEARKLLNHFFNTYFSDPDKLVYPKNPINIPNDKDESNKIFMGNNYAHDYKILSRKIRDLGETIPPLFNAYMNLSPSMRHFGTGINDKFGEVEETGILITVEDIYESKKKRHRISYIPNLKFKLPKKIRRTPKIL